MPMTDRDRRRPVAVCISGLARSFKARRVRRSIWAHMVWPIIEAAEVFWAIDESHAGRKYMATEATEGWREEALALFAPVYATRLEASESLHESLGVCRALVTARESERSERFRWVLRLRPDATYRRALPPLARWPPLADDARLVWSTYIGGPSCSRSVPKNAAAKGVCLDDNFALMTRAALDVYFAPWPRDADDCQPALCTECRLGCALKQAGIRVGSLPVDLRLHRGEPKLANKTRDKADDPDVLDRLADRVIAKYELEEENRRVQDDQVLADDFADAHRRGLLKAKHFILFLSVEPCRDGLVQLSYETASREIGVQHAAASLPVPDATEGTVHGLPAPLADSHNDWLGCAPPPWSRSR